LQSSRKKKVLKKSEKHVEDIENLDIFWK